MYNYHESPLRTERLEKDRCRCDSDDSGAVFDIEALLLERRVRDPYKDGAFLSSVAAPPDRMSADGLPPRYIYAVGLDYSVRIALDGDRPTMGSVKHETLYHNKDVRAAGEIGFHEGVVTSINDHSGSYNTDNYIENDPQFAEALLKAFPADTIEMSPILRARLEELR